MTTVLPAAERGSMTRLSASNALSAISADQIMRLAAAQMEAERVAQCIDQGMDLGAQATTRPPDRLVLAGFFGRRRCAGGRARWCCRSWRIRCRPRSRGVRRRVATPRVGPAAEAPMHLHTITEALGQVAPGYASPVAIEHRLDKQPIVRRRDPDPAWLPRQQMLDPLPLVVTQAITAHRSAPNS